jgi:hypothetical protein
LRKRRILKVKKPAVGPAIPMEKMFAPRVVNPPCAKSNAWNMRTMAERSDVVAGPYRITDNPVPVGWEDEPVTDGICSEESTNINAPDTASTSFCSGLSRNIFATFRAPHTTKGIATKNQNKHQIGGKKPSAMCTFHHALK